MGSRSADVVVHKREALCTSRLRSDADATDVLDHGAGWAAMHHKLHGTSGDCASLGGTKAIASELCGRQIAHLCTLAHAHHDPLAHASPAALVEAVRAL